MRLAIQDAIRAAIEAGQASRSVAIPGIVVSYSQTTKRADIQPALNRLVPGETEGTFVSERLPVIHDVTVIWPSGGGTWLQGALAPGEGVLLVCCDYDPSEYLRKGGVSDPADVRTGSLSHAVAIPGLAPAPNVTPSSPLCAVGGDDLSVAVAERVKQFIDLLQVQLTGAGATPLTGASLSTLVTTALTNMSAPVTPGASGAFGSNVLKVGS